MDQTVDAPAHSYLKTTAKPLPYSCAICRTKPQMFTHSPLLHGPNSECASLSSQSPAPAHLPKTNPDVHTPTSAPCTQQPMCQPVKPISCSCAPAQNKPRCSYTHLCSMDPTVDAPAPTSPEDSPSPPHQRRAVLLPLPLPPSAWPRGPGASLCTAAQGPGGRLPGSCCLRLYCRQRRRWGHRCCCCCWLPLLAARSSGAAPGQAMDEQRNAQLKKSHGMQRRWSA